MQDCGVLCASGTRLAPTVVNTKIRSTEQSVRHLSTQHHRKSTLEVQSYRKFYNFAHPGAYLKNHSCNLHAPLCVKFCPHSDKIFHKLWGTFYRKHFSNTLQGAFFIKNLENFLADRDENAKMPCYNNNMWKLKDALRIVPYFVFTTVGAVCHWHTAPCPIFAYREADAPRLCLRSASVGAKRTSTGCSAPYRAGH